MSDEIDPDWPAPAYQPSDDVDTTPPAPGGSWPTAWLVALVVLACVAAAVVAYAGMHRVRPGANQAAPATTSAPARPTSPASQVGPCGPDEATAVRAALAQLAPDSKTGRPWNSTPEDSNYDPCADLSAVLVTVQDATNSSPDQALMFHRGTFVGTATPTAYPFTNLIGPASTNDIVVLSYRTRQSCDGCQDGILTIVGFAWRGDHVQILDSLPELFDAPP